MFDRITVNPHLMGGRACIRGMRIPVSLIVRLVANNMDIPEILSEYPDLERADIHQALQYAGMGRNEFTFGQTSEVFKTSEV